MRTFAVLVGVCLIVLAGCSRRAGAGWQGYVEGEYVYVSSPISGRLETLAVQKGTRVEQGAPLFTLEHSSEAAARREASDQLNSALSRLADLRKGSRPTEIAALQARLGQARAAALLSQIDLDREEKLLAGGAISQSDYDHARLTHEQNRRAVDELSSELATARLGGREDAIKAAESDVQAARAALARADWNVNQKSQVAPGAALVYDTLYRVGEFVTAGSPVVSLLPPADIKVRFFVSADDFASLKTLDTVLVAVPGRAGPLQAHVSFLSPQPEFTPPGLYNRDNRSKLVFMVEAVFAPADARDLHPGQPVDVSKAGP